MVTPPDLSIVPANEVSWEDLQAIFGSRGDPSRCFRQRYKPAGVVGVGRCGRARRDGEEIVRVVEHHMESAYPPELLDEGPDRPFRITGDQLTLGDGRTSRRL